MLEFKCTRIYATIKCKNGGIDMDAKEYVLQHVDGRRLLSLLKFEQISDDNDKEIRAVCKIHSGSNPMSFAYYLDTNTWYCHSCHEHGDAYQLVQTLMDKTFPQAIVYLAEVFGVDIHELRLINAKSDNQKEQEEWLKAIEEMEKQYEVQEYTITSDVKAIKGYRHFTEETVNRFGLMYSSEYTIRKKNGEPALLKNRLVFPVIFSNKLVGVSLRRVDNNDVPKWLHQGYKSGEILYNYDECLEYLKQSGEDFVYIVEGIIDVMSFYQQGIYNVVATFGARLTTKQIELLQGLTSEVYLAYDGDAPGRLKVYKTVQLIKHCFDIKVLNFEEGVDPGSCEDLRKIPTTSSNTFIRSWSHEFKKEKGSDV